MIYMVLTCDPWDESLMALPIISSSSKFIKFIHMISNGFIFQANGDTSRALCITIRQVWTSYQQGWNLTI